MVDINTLAFFLAITAVFYIPGVLKLTEIVYENLMASRGFIRVYLFFINRRASTYYVKPKNKRINAAGGEFEFNDHPDFMFYFKRMPTIWIDAKTHKQLQVFNANAPQASVSADQLDGIARHSYNIGFREALKKFVNWDKFLILILILSGVAAAAAVYVAMNVVQKAAA
jgi:hypothetical protein